MKAEKQEEIRGDTEDVGGTVVYWYDQGTMPAARQNAVLSRGMCQALCMIWVAVRKAGGNFQGLVTNEAAVNPHAQTIMTAQNTVLGRARTSGGDSSVAYGSWMVRWGHLLGYTVSVGFLERAHSGSMARTILQRHGLTIAGFQNDRGGHAMVAHFSGDEIHFFDPNAGEFRIPKAGFTEWFATFFYTMGYQASPTEFWAIAHIA